MDEHGTWLKTLASQTWRKRTTKHLVFDRLDRGFKYDAMTELPDDFETFFIKLRRRNGQTVQDYQGEFTKVERKLDATHSVKLPEKVRAWWFLRRSGVS